MDVSRVAISGCIRFYYRRDKKSNETRVFIHSAMCGSMVSMVMV